MSQTEPVFTLGDEVGPPTPDPTPPPQGDGPPPPPPRKGRPTQLDTIEEELAGFFTMVGAGVAPFNAYDGQVIVAGADPLALAFRHLAEKNAKVKARLLAMLEAGAYGEVVIAASMIALPILVNHGLIPVNVPEGGYTKASQNGHNE